MPLRPKKVRKVSRKLSRSWIWRLYEFTVGSSISRVCTQVAAGLVDTTGTAKTQPGRWETMALWRLGTSWELVVWNSSFHFPFPPLVMFPISLQDISVPSIPIFLCLITSLSFSWLLLLGSLWMSNSMQPVPDSDFRRERCKWKLLTFFAFFCSLLFFCLTTARKSEWLKNLFPHAIQNLRIVEISW